MQGNVRCESSERLIEQVTGESDSVLDSAVTIRVGVNARTELRRRFPRTEGVVPRQSAHDCWPCRGHGAQESGKEHELIDVTHLRVKALESCETPSLNELLRTTA